MSAVGDAPLLERIAKVMGYISASSKGGKKGERDSAFIRSILIGGNPAAGSDAQVRAACESWMINSRVFRGSSSYWRVATQLQAAMHTWRVLGQYDGGPCGPGVVCKGFCHF